jgi:DNA-binding transcriptional MerR regulator
MSAQQSKSLRERRAELERQLRRLAGRRNELYMPGVTLISGEPPPLPEQIELEIEELQAAIAEIDEELKRSSEA